MTFSRDGLRHSISSQNLLARSCDRGYLKTRGSGTWAYILRMIMCKVSLPSTRGFCGVLSHQTTHFDTLYITNKTGPRTSRSSTTLAMSSSSDGTAPSGATIASSTSHSTSRTSSTTSSRPSGVTTSRRGSGTTYRRRTRPSISRTTRPDRFTIWRGGPLPRMSTRLGTTRICIATFIFGSERRDHSTIILASTRSTQ